RSTTANCGNPSRAQKIGGRWIIPLGNAGFRTSDASSESLLSRRRPRVRVPSLPSLELRATAAAQVLEVSYLRSWASGESKLDELCRGGSGIWGSPEQPPPLIRSRHRPVARDRARGRRRRRGGNRH